MPFPGMEKRELVGESRDFKKISLDYRMLETPIRYQIDSLRAVKKNEGCLCVFRNCVYINGI